MKDYKKILEGVVNIINTTEKSDIGFANICTYIRENCPELKESEDEKMKRIISDILLIDNDDIREILESNDVLMQDIDAWLEKQGEQKPVLSDDALREGIAHFGITQYQITNWLKKYVDVEKQDEQKPTDKVEPKFKIGDWIVNDYCAGKIIALTDDAYLLDSGQGIPFSCEHNAHLWTIEDAQDGDLIYVSTEDKGIQAIFHKFENGIIYFHCYLCGDFTQGGYMPIGSVELVYPLQKTHYKRFFEKMHEAGYKWNADKKELKEIKQKSAWSEEDRIRITNCIDLIGKTGDGEVEWLKSLESRIIPQTKQEWSEKDKNRFRNLIYLVEHSDEGKGTKEGFVKFINRLKSLRSQTTWKPSEEQMNALDDAISSRDIKYNILSELWKDLKKLREE